MHDPDIPEKPLDAAQLRLQARMTRLLFGSGAIMLAGLIAVFAAILYRVKSAESRPVLDPSRPALVETLPLPEGGRVVATALEGTTLIVTIEGGRGNSILLVDTPTLKAVRRLDLVRP